MEIKEKHEKMLYPTVRVRTDQAGGSGTVIYSEEDPLCEGQYETYVLTNNHVIASNVTVGKEWSTLLQREIKKDTFKECSVEFFDFEYGSWEGGSRTSKATIMCYHKEMDLALLKLQSGKKADYVATLFPHNEYKQRLRIFQKVFAVGCGLGHPTLATEGQLNGFDDMIDNHPYILSSAPTIYGNCLIGDSLVSMGNNTVKPIKDINIGDSVFVSTNNGMSVEFVDDIINSGKKKIFKLKTRTRTIKASENHPFLVVTTAKNWNGRLYNFLEWKQLRDINCGDVIAVMNSAPERLKGVGIRFADYIGQEKSKHDFMRFLGFYLGDGWIRRRDGISYELGLATYNKEITEKYQNILSDLFQINNFGNDENNITVSKKNMVEMIESLGLAGKSTERTIPDWVMTQPTDLQMAFIEGYLEADGHINPLNDWVFEANNKNLISKLRMMFIHLGYNVSNISERLREERFINGRKAIPNSPSFSFQVYINYSKSKNCYIEGSKEFLPSHMNYERISNIEEIGEEDTYDIKLSKVHNFFADGVLVHNSGGSLYLAETGELIGVPSRIAVTAGMLGGSDAITHLSFSIPIWSVYKFLEDQIFDFIFKPEKTSAICVEERRRKRERDERQLAVDATKECEPDTQTDGFGLQ